MHRSGKLPGLDSSTGLAKDPAEQHDFSAQDPEKRQELMAHWDEYVTQSNVIVSRWNMLEIMSRKGLPDP